jgi:hypothetical protein
MVLPFSYLGSRDYTPSTLSAEVETALAAVFGHLPRQLCRVDKFADDRTPPLPLALLGWCTVEHVANVIDDPLEIVVA